ncbi:hypothetical protein BKA67DRAFT_596175 [Truncatella angustata]|uniref:Zn(2)-C6 fungal-type domain-containing protein n=1 Tax=Truncatella angustata TaxID=152316 RepID=A0A9P8RF30_9PEZI|nr:uncharacterized protein BKA67DRAFT_596175 [Truncatella angustata]KAH6643428.1 hypothetical protein BKA67DRAFT_596175 [Truncatella angustata]
MSQRPMIVKLNTQVCERTGCKNCKSRKVKCDERKPACSNCVKRQIDCDFMDFGSPVSGPSSTPGLESACSLNMRDLELLHNYSTSTYRTLSEDLAMREFYRVSVVQVGLGCDYIMRALLAISSLHLALHRPHLKSHYQSMAMTQHQLASRVAIPLMSEVTPESAQKLFLFSTLTVYYALAGPRRSVDDGLLLEEATFPDWVFLSQGPHGLLSQAGAMDQGPLSPIIKHGIMRYELREKSAHLESTAHAQLSELEVSIMRQDLPERLRRIYGIAIAELKKSFSQLQHSQTPYELTDAFVWIYVVAEDLLPLLRAPTQEAVAIFAFFCVLLKALDGQWWLQGWGQHLISRAYALLDDEWRLRIRWPIDEIGWIPLSAFG